MPLDLCTLEDATDAPDVPDLHAGTAAEHLVCADLLLQGYDACLTAQHFAYDIVVSVPEERLLRVQVKATRKPKHLVHRPNGDSTVYQFNAKRAGKGGKRLYKPNAFDMFACVALDIRAIAYIAVNLWVPQIIQLRPPEAKRTHANCKHPTIDNFPFEAAIFG